MTDPLFSARLLTLAIKTLAFGMCAAAFWRFRGRSQWKAVCLALTISFGFAVVMGLARMVCAFIPGSEPYLIIVEIPSSIISVACAVSIVTQVWR